MDKIPCASSSISLSFGDLSEFFLILYKNDRENLSMRTAQVFIPLMRFPTGFEKCSCSSEEIFSYFFFSSMKMSIFDFFISACNFSFYSIFPDMAVPFLSLFPFHRFSLSAWHFLKKKPIPFLYPCCIFLLFVTWYLVLFHF